MNERTDACKVHELLDELRMKGIWAVLEKYSGVTVIINQKSCIKVEGKGAKIKYCGILCALQNEFMCSSEVGDWTKGP